MKLAVLGVAVLVLGAVQGITGLMAVGGLWIVLAPLGWRHRRQFEAARDAAVHEDDVRREQTGDGEQSRAVDGRLVAEGTLVMLAVGLPALAVGVLGLGFDATDSAWRWLPIGVGGLATGIAVVSGLLYVLGAGLSASAGSGKGPRRRRRSRSARCARPGCSSTSGRGCTFASSSSPTGYLRTP